jgi:hypothetical protein
MCDAKGGEKIYVGNRICLDFGAMMGDASR